MSVSVRLLGKLRRRWVDNVKMDRKKELNCAPDSLRVGRSDGLLLARELTVGFRETRSSLSEELVVSE